jgi:acyl dehydratase
VKFTDFSVGQIIDAGSLVVDEASVVAFAAQFDPQPFHVDKTAAAAGHWNGLIASGFHTCGMAMRLVVDKVLRGSDSYASPGLEYVKWPSPVRPGDLLSLKLEILDVRRSRSGEYGIVRWHWIMTNQSDSVVLDLIATSFFGGAKTG